MQRSGFSMIELIFAIVIIGILAAVALPRLGGMVSETREAKVVELVGSLNSAVGPQMWGQSMTGGTNGSINGMTLENYIELPTQMTCENSGTNQMTTALSGMATGSYTKLCDLEFDNEKVADLYVRDGNSTDQPRFGFDSAGATTL